VSVAVEVEVTIGGTADAEGAQAFKNKRTSAEKIHTLE
jgi:hypothetical protein